MRCTRLLHAAVTLCTISSFPDFTFAKPINISDAARTTSWLPIELKTILPSCATTCVELFVFTSFSASSCPDFSSLDCLCTTNTTSGFTLGEAAVRCIASDCNNNATAEAQVYNVCDAVAGALPRTHATITATAVASHQTSSNAYLFTTTNSGGTVTETPPTSSISQILTATGSPSVPASTSSIVSSRTSSGTINATAGAESSSPSAASNQPKPGLSRSQIIGISGGIGGSIALGFCLLFCVYRTRRSHQEAHRRRSSDLTPFQTDLAFRRNSGDPYSVAAAQKETHNRDPFGAKTPSPPPALQRQSKYWEYYAETDPEKIGVAVSPELPQQASPPMSPTSPAGSQRSQSKLLPDKPQISNGFGYGLWPAPLRPRSQIAPPQQSQRFMARPESTATEFEDEDNGNQRPPVAEPRPAMTTVVAPSTRIDLSDPRARMYAVDRSVMPPNPTYNPYYAPEQAPSTYMTQATSGQGQWHQRNPADPEAMPTSIPGPLPRALTNFTRPGMFVQLPPRAPSSTYSTNASLPPSEGRVSTAPPTSTYSRTPYSQSIQQPTSRPRRLSRTRKSYSLASDTSFEGDSDDEEMYRQPPRDENIRNPKTRHTKTLSALSPVNEMDSPGSKDEKSPIADIKYPALPRPANLSPQAEYGAIPRAAQTMQQQQQRGRQQDVRPNNQDDVFSIPSKHPDRNLYQPTDRGRQQIINYPPQAVLRPPQAMRPRDESPSTLLAKRRGSRAASELEKGRLRLQIGEGTTTPQVKKWRIVNDNEDDSRGRNANCDPPQPQQQQPHPQLQRPTIRTVHNHQYQPQQSQPQYTQTQFTTIQPQTSYRGIDIGAKLLPPNPRFYSASQYQEGRESVGSDIMSPAWEPMLTPERRGDDLVLTVRKR